MVKVKPFLCIRPAEAVVSKVAALPYDVYSRKEAKVAAMAEPLSFLNIDRPETQFADEFDMYSDEAYAKAKELLNARVQDGTFVVDEQAAYYIYRLVMDGRAQTGLVACSSVDDYVNGVVKKHENTREDKEIDRIRHVDTVDAQTGPIFLAYRADDTIRSILRAEMQKTPLYDFVSEDGIGHTVWKIESAKVTKALEEAFLAVPATYIADGHHRAASAVKVGLMRRKENPGWTGEEPYNMFLSVLFPDEELKIFPYNRVVKDLNGLKKAGFLEKISENFMVQEMGHAAFSPEHKGTFGMYLDGCWYCLTAKEAVRSSDPVKGLDVSILQDALLEPVLGIFDPRTDGRIEFIGGIRGLEELERRVNEERKDMAVAFSMYPTSMDELLSVADAGLLMPPKSTWFEPKLRSGLFIHPLDR